MSFVDFLKRFTVFLSQLLSAQSQVNTDAPLIRTHKAATHFHVFRRNIVAQIYTVFLRARNKPIKPRK